MYKDGNKIDKEGYLIDENGNYLSSGGEAVKQDEAGGWWKVDKNGNYLGTSSDGRDISIKEDADGKWYEVDENNNIVTDADGNKVEAVGANRIVRGVSIPHPTGEVELGPEAEKQKRREQILQALELLSKKV